MCALGSLGDQSLQENTRRTRKRQEDPCYHDDGAAGSKGKGGAGPSLGQLLRRGWACGSLRKPVLASHDLTCHLEPLLASQ